jgi:hypothetical protein
MAPRNQGPLRPITPCLYTDGSCLPGADRCANRVGNAAHYPAWRATLHTSPLRPSNGRSSLGSELPRRPRYPTRASRLEATKTLASVAPSPTRTPHPAHLPWMLWTVMMPRLPKPTRPSAHTKSPRRVRGLLLMVAPLTADTLAVNCLADGTVGVIHPRWLGVRGLGRAVPLLPVRPLIRPTMPVVPAPTAWRDGS